MNSNNATIFFLFVLGAICAGFFLLQGCSMTYDGEKLFFREGCSNCHSYKGRGGRMGPDISAVTNIRSAGWIDSYLQDPKKINPLSRMPSFRHLSRSKRKAIIAFFLFFSLFLFHVFQNSSSKYNFWSKYKKVLAIMVN